MKLNKQSAAMIRILLFSIGLILSCNVFARNATDTNAGTLCNAGQYLDGDGSCIAIPVDTDTNTNAGTLCNAGQYLVGGGSCIAIPENLPQLPLEGFEGALRICGNSDTPQWGPCLYAIGNTGPAGGIVFHITNDGLHGLEAAPVGWYDGDVDPSLSWGCSGTLTGASKTAIGTGAQNTADILAGCSESGIAAEIVDDYELNGYTDWFLPSKDELNALYPHKDDVGGFANAGYWSSSESSSPLESSRPILAQAQNFANGSQADTLKAYPLRVRAVRAF